MKKMIRAILAAAAVAAMTCAYGFSLPLVGTGTELNKWSRNMDGVLAAAKTTGYPIFLVMINDSSSGEGCEHCKNFVERTLNTPEFDAIVSDYKFYLVLLNVWGADSAQSQPNYGGVSSSVFFNYFYKYITDGGYPLVAVLRPDGTKYKGWGDTTLPSTRGTILNQYIRAAIADLSEKAVVTKFDLAAESGNTVVVQVDGTTVKPGTWKGVVKRSGSSGDTGSVVLSLSGANAAQYSLSTTTLDWDSSDGTKSFAVTGPKSSNGDILSDTVMVNITARGFDEADVSYGVRSQSVTFKDSRVKQSLAEFAAANSGLEGLSSVGGTWFVPAAKDGNVLETVTASSSSLEFAAKAGGILTVDVGANNAGIVEATANGKVQELNANNPVSFEVAAGQKITFKAVSRGRTAGTIGFTKLVFEAALPSFDNVPTKIDAYKSVKANLDLSVASKETVTYSATGLPTGLKINKTTGKISGSPWRMGSSKVTVTAKCDNGEVSTTFTLSVGKLPKEYTKGTYVCFSFDNAGNLKSSATVKMQTSGKWTAKITENGATASLKGGLESTKDGRLSIKSGNVLDIAFDGSTRMWSGTSHSRQVYGKAVDKADAQWKGVWNSGVFTSASPALGGWVTAKVANSGQVAFTGSIANKLRISGKGYSAVFPASFVAANLPRWAGHGNVRFVYMGKQDGGYALCADGTLGGRLTVQSVVYDEIDGSKWSGESIAALNGAVFKTIGGASVAIPVAVTGNKLSAGKNDFKARISATLKSGRVNASYSNGSKAKASGVLYLSNKTPMAAGGGSVGADTFAFVIE